MVAPVFSALTERLYARLPDAVREQDALQTVGYPLKRWLSGLADQAGGVEVILNRIDYYGPDEGGVAGDTSDLADPNTADDAWLDWLAQLVGVKLAFGLTTAQRRAAVGNAVSGFRAGTKKSIAAAAQTALTGAKAVSVYDHTMSTGSIGAGGQWDVAIVSRSSETASAQAVLDAVINAGAKPAGVKLWHRFFEATWDQLEAGNPNWNAIDSKTWAQLEETGL